MTSITIESISVQVRDDSIYKKEDEANRASHLADKRCNISRPGLYCLTKDTNKQWPMGIEIGFEISAICINSLQGHPNTWPTLHRNWSYNEPKNLHTRVAIHTS